MWPKLHLTGGGSYNQECSLFAVRICGGADLGDTVDHKIKIMPKNSMHLSSLLICPLLLLFGMPVTFPHLICSPCPRQHFSATFNEAPESPAKIFL